MTSFLLPCRVSWLFERFADLGEDLGAEQLEAVSNRALVLIEGAGLERRREHPLQAVLQELAADDDISYFKVRRNGAGNSRKHDQVDFLRINETRNGGCRSDLPPP